MAFSHSPKIVTDGLVLCLDAGNTKSYPGTGTNWKDLSGNGNNGTLTNGPTYSSVNGGSLSFDGVNDVVDLPSSNALTGDNLQNMSAEMWLKYTATTTMYAFSVKRSNIASTLISITVNQNNGSSIGHLGMLVRNYGDSAHEWTTHGGGYNDGNWHHICAVVDGTYRRAYIDGIERAVTTGGIQSVTGNTFSANVGAFHADSNSFQGDIAATRFYRKALSASEVLQNYNATKGRFGL